MSINGNDLNSNESYDVLPDKWSSMPNMNSGKYCHSLVVIKNKLFVVSNIEDNCEVFDKICKKFITIKSPKFYRFFSIKAFSIENKIFAFQEGKSKIISYDTDKNKWSEEFCKVSRELGVFSCVKIPCV